MDMYRYARSKLRAAPAERQLFIKMFTARVIKSMSRVTATNIHRNRWLALINLLNNSISDDDFINDMKIAASLKAKGAPKGVMRLKLMLGCVQHNLSDQERLSLLFTSHKPEFVAADDFEFLRGVANRHSIEQHSCGHFHTESFVLFGDSDSHVTSQYVCGACAKDLLRRDVRVQHGLRTNQLILREFAVLARYQNNNADLWMDRRSSEVVYNERGRFYHHRDWSPYRDLIADYHSSKRKGFNQIPSTWLKSNRRAFGCELEVQVVKGDANAAAGRVHEALNPSGDIGEYCFFERDGSIGTGFELITQPAGLDVHREKFAKFLQDPDMKRGMRSHEGGSCGFHVHVGREFLTQSQIFRIQAFLNDRNNEALIKKVARRYNSGYSRFKSELAKVTPYGKNTGDRYEALNVTGKHTVEFRIFRGSLRYESIMAALEFVNAVCNFCTPGVASILNFNAQGFHDFIMQYANRADTKYLRSYLSLDENSDQENVIQQAA